MKNGQEQARQRIQTELDSCRGIDYRRRLGQFATPIDFAKEIVTYGITLLSDDRIRFLEPALGTGAFYSALQTIVDVNKLDSAIGLEIDAKVANAAETIWDGGKLHVVNADFAKAAPVQPLANLLISNPPYVRHHYIATKDKSKMQSEIVDSLGINLSGLAGLYCYFILLSHKWLANGAVSGWLVPSEFMDVNYGAGIKDYLLNKVKLLRIHRYSPGSVKFEDALVSSAVVWYAKEEVNEDYEVEFSFGGTLDRPDIKKMIKRSVLKAERKWTRFPVSDARVIDTNRAKIKDAFEVKRGIATGDNSFFILDRPKIEKYGLASDYLIPVLPSPRYLKTSEVFADEEGNPLLDNQLFLISCDLPENQIRSLYPELYSYLQMGINSVSERYLCKAKRYWYFQEQRKPAPILCTYMGRGNRDTELPFRFILNHSKAIATNSYLMLYPKENYYINDEMRMAQMKAVWQDLNNLTLDALVSEARIYGGGLRKIEPRELGEVQCGAFADSLQLEVFHRAG